MAGVVLSAILPILITVAIGFLWARAGRKIQSPDLTALIADIATPCLIVSTFQKTHVSPAAFGAMAGAAALAILLFALCGAVILKALGLKLRTFLPSVAFPNAGNLGLPVALYAFGDEGLGYAIVFFSISSIANYTLGQAIAAGQANWRGLVRLPILYAIALAVALSLASIQLPVWLGSTVSLIGGLTVPIMLLLLGASISSLGVASAGRAAAVSLVRIGMGAAVGFAVAALFGFTGVIRAVLVMQAANPVAVYNYLFAQRWNNEPEQVAGVVVVSTLMSVVTIPLLLAALI
ncbi:AEC family transporter [Alsobacter sp. KACC 23698]|uniref:AEC family transporter n=1 Tax=Alsobacter sp. KACC 23698 TaxID=3149229 RepID=A0AAU7JIX4_9HYPH